MVYNYKREINTASWSEQNLQNAILETNRTSILNASRRYGIPYTTLHRHMVRSYRLKGIFCIVFTLDEIELLNYVHKIDSIFYGLNRVEFLQLTREFTKKKREQKVVLHKM